MTVIKLLLTISLAYVLFFLGKKSIAKFVTKIALERNVIESRAHYIRGVLTLVWAALILISSGVIVGIGYHDVGLFFGSVFALVGVALFAQWSILSNVTASIIVFFFFPYRVGDSVKIIDDKNTISGTIKEITLFHVILDNGDEGLVTYPNAMVFQKAVAINVNRTNAKEEEIIKDDNTE